MLGEKRKCQYLLLQFIVALVSAQTGPECPRKCTCDYYSAVHTIDCSSQDFNEFPVGIPTWTTSLTFDGNYLSVLNLASFNITTYFEKLRIRYNEIEHIQLDEDETHGGAGAKGTCRQAGKIFPRLMDVNLKGNRLRFLPKCVLSIWPRLKYLNLNENQFENIKDLHLIGHQYYYRSIETLQLKGNRISRLNKYDWFSPSSALGKLKILDLSANRIRRIQTRFFTFLTELRDVQLQENLLRSIPDYAFLTMGRKIERIKLNDNRIGVMSRKAFAGLPRLSRLDLSGNQIRCLNPESISTRLAPPQPSTRRDLKPAIDLSSLRQLQIGKNPWKCDCKLTAMTMSERLKDLVAASFRSGATCATPLRFRGSSLVAAAERIGNCTRN